MKPSTKGHVDAAMDLIAATLEDGSISRENRVDLSHAWAHLDRALAERIDRPEEGTSSMNKKDWNDCSQIEDALSDMLEGSGLSDQERDCISKARDLMVAAMYPPKKTLSDQEIKNLVERKRDNAVAPLMTTDEIRRQIWPDEETTER